MPLRWRLADGFEWPAPLRTEDPASGIEKSSHLQEKRVARNKERMEPLCPVGRLEVAAGRRKHRAAGGHLPHLLSVTG